MTAVKEGISVVITCYSVRYHRATSREKKVSANKIQSLDVVSHVTDLVHQKRESKQLFTRTGKNRKLGRIHEQPQDILRTQHHRKHWKSTLRLTAVPDPTPLYISLSASSFKNVVPLFAPPLPLFIAHACRGRKQPSWPARAPGWPLLCCALCTLLSSVPLPALASPPTDGS